MICTHNVWQEASDPGDTDDPTCKKHRCRPQALQCYASVDKECLTSHIGAVITSKVNCKVRNFDRLAQACHRLARLEYGYGLSVVSDLCKPNMQRRAVDDDRTDAVKTKALCYEVARY